MTQPSVEITELDGSLGVLPSSAGKLLAVVGVSSQGPLDTPAAYGRITDLVATFGIGPMVEAAARFIHLYSRPVVVVRTGQTVAGDYPADDAVVRTGTGTSVITVDDTGTAPDDDYEVKVEVLTGGTIGVTGIRLRYSLDDGRTWSPPVALGIATTYVIPGTGGVEVEFAAGTLVTGDTASFRATAPNWNAAELTTALTALRHTVQPWEIVHIVGPTDGDAFDAIALAMSGMASAGKDRLAIAHTRMPTLAETEAAYKTALDAIFTSKASTFIALCAGSQEMTSSVSGRKYRRPPSFAYAPLEASVSEEANVAAVRRGLLTAVSIRDANGNPKHHDESVNPGLDDSRFVALRTWDQRQGVYVNRPLLFSAAGSDFQLVPHRRVMNVGKSVLREYMIDRLNLELLVSAATGFILESEAREIEAAANALLRASLRSKPKTSDVSFLLSRTDNLLSTKTLTGRLSIVPLAYPETISLEVGFVNPALQVTSV